MLFLIFFCFLLFFVGFSSDFCKRRISKQPPNIPQTLQNPSLVDFPLLGLFAISDISGDILLSGKKHCQALFFSGIFCQGRTFFRDFFAHAFSQHFFLSKNESPIFPHKKNMFPSEKHFSLTFIRGQIGENRQGKDFGGFKVYLQDI